MAAIGTVLIFRSELLPPSEAFIVEQTRTMQTFTPVFAGLKQLQNAIPLYNARTITMTGPANTIDNKLRRKLFCEARFGFAFLNRLAKESPALIHAHFAVDACLALPVKRRLNVPLIVTLHGYDVTRNDAHLRRTVAGRIYLRRCRELWSNASLFVCVSDFIRQKALKRGFPEEKLWVHRIGVDLETFRPSASRVIDPPLALFVGRLVENKGCIHLIRAMARVQEVIPNARLVVIGDGPLRASLEAVARTVLRRCMFTGMKSHSDVRRWMQQASVLVMPSIEVESGDSEGLGMVMCEAQALGLPGIGFRGTGVEEALAHGESGLLVDPSDEAGLGDAMVRVLQDEGLQRSLAVAGRRHAEAYFDLRRQTALLEAKYSEIVSAK